MKELTPLSISLGIVIGVVMTAANVYLGLYAGMTVSASIPAAVIAMGVFRGILKKKSPLETNIVQTMASAGESLAAGVIFTLPALVIVGAWEAFHFWHTTLIAISGGLLGVVFMVPLRKALIVEDKDLVYPEGVACAAVIESTDDSGKSGGFKTILQGLGLGAAGKFLSSGLAVTTGAVEWATKGAGKVLFLGLDASAALMAVGYIVKMEVAILVFLGGFVGWYVAIPMLGTPEGMESLSALDLSWTLWSKQVRYLGVGAMITGGLWSIFSVRSGISSGLSGLKSAYQNKNGESEDISLGLMTGIIGVCFCLMVGIYSSFIDSFGITLMTTGIMMVASFLFVAVSSYIVGLVGSSNNPVSGMTISALLATSAMFLVLGFQGDSAILATLGVAAVVCCAACTAGDCSQDLKTGSLLGATPRSQQIAQLIGVVIPAFVIAPVLSLLHSAYGIGTGLKAPQATLFASITKALFGKGQLPMNMVYIGVILGIIIIVINETFLKTKKFKLHLMPIAVGIYLPVTLAVPMIFGAIIRLVMEKSSKNEISESDDGGILLSSGLIAGEALMGVAVAVLLYMNVDIKIFKTATGINEIYSLIVLFMIWLFLLRVSKKSYS